MGEIAAAATLEKQRLTAEEEEAADGKSSRRSVVEVQPKPKKGLVSSAVDFLERVIVYLMHDSSKPLHYLAGNFAPVRDETPPSVALSVHGSLPVCLNGEFVRVGPNPKFPPVAGYHWFDGDGLCSNHYDCSCPVVLRIKDVLIDCLYFLLAGGALMTLIEFICDNKNDALSMPTTSKSPSDYVGLLLMTTKVIIVFQPNAIVGKKEIVSSI